jgi:hypothetical protein
LEGLNDQLGSQSFAEQSSIQQFDEQKDFDAQPVVIESLDPG